MFRQSVFLGSLLFLLGGTAVSAANWQRHTVMHGTPYATVFYSFTTGQKGPTVVCISPHADERSAPLFLQQLVKDYYPGNGTLMVWPVPVKPAWVHKKRFWIEDLNRQFGVVSDSYTPEDVIAGVLKFWLLENQPDLVLNVHEGYQYFRANWHGYGQSLVVDAVDMVSLCRQVLAGLNPGIYYKNRFYITVKPMENTLTWWCRQHGLKAVGIEILRTLPLSQKITYQRLVVTAMLKGIGMELKKKGSK